MNVIHTQGLISGRSGYGPIAVLDDDTHMSKWVQSTQRLCDPQGVDVLALKFIPEGCLAIDVGAMLGDHTTLYAQKASTVHAFEPQSACFECLRENCSHLPNVVPHQVALSDASGESFITQESNVGMGKLAAKGEPISRRLLDTFGLSPQFIKWDIEGHEIHGLRGASETIMQAKPIMVVEVHKYGLYLAGGFTITDLKKELDRLGYHRCWDINTGAHFDPKDDKDGYNIVCEAHDN
jgi:FkbM family methyltransferase